MIVSRERKLLVNRHARAPLGVYGKGAAVMGAIASATGFFILAMGMKWIHSKPGSVHVPFWVLSAIGLSFLAAGLSISFNGLRDMARTKWVGQARLRSPEKPWLWDFAWDSSKASFDPYEKAFKGLMACVFLFLFLTPFNWLMFN